MKNLILLIGIAIFCYSCSICWSIDKLVDRLEFEREVMYNTKYVTVDSIKQRKYDNLIYVHGYSNKFYYRFPDTLSYQLNQIIYFTDDIYSKSIMKPIKN